MLTGRCLAYIALSICDCAGIAAGFGLIEFVTNANRAGNFWTHLTILCYVFHQPADFTATLIKE